MIYDMEELEFYHYSDFTYHPSPQKSSEITPKVFKSLTTD